MKLRYVERNNKKDCLAWELPHYFKWSTDSTNRKETGGLFIKTTMISRRSLQSKDINKSNGRLNLRKGKNSLL